MTRLLLLIFLPISCFSQIKNTVISALNTPNEVSISVNPNNVAEVIAAANINNFYFSTDTGKTWNHEYAISKYGVAGDPVTFISSKGEKFFVHLSIPPNGNWIDRIVVQKKNDLLENWKTDTYTGLNKIKSQDKHWICENPINNELYLTWTQFDEYGVADESKKSNILFSKSTDDGKTWSSAARINEISGNCIDNDNTVEGAVPSCGLNGDIYVAWAGPEGLVLDKSTNGGTTWREKDVKIDAFVGGWNYDISGIYRCNGMPITKVDLSKSKYSGRVYINWSDQSNGENDTDVWLIYSDDQGETWSKKTKVNQDKMESHQFMSWMDVDETSGNVFIVYYDRRHHFDNKTDVFMSVSEDGGSSFIDYQISESFFEPDSTVFFGDYTNVDANQNLIFPIWTRLDSRKLKVVTHPIELSRLVNYDYNSFNIIETSAYSLIIRNKKNEVIKTLFADQKIQKGTFNIDISKYDVSLMPDIYYFELLLNDKLIVRKHFKI